jgi:hypothetical protein
VLKVGRSGGAEHDVQTGSPMIGPWSVGEMARFLREAGLRTDRFF